MTAIVLAVIAAVLFVCPQTTIQAAESGTIRPSSQVRIPIQKPPAGGAVLPLGKACPDLKVSLTASHASVMAGHVRLSGSVVNSGFVNYSGDSLIQCIMNLRYPPKTYNMVGVSEIIFTQPLTSLQKGASLPVGFEYVIPDFGQWVQNPATATAVRMFTLRVVRRDMMPYGRDEDCSDGNNDVSVEVFYNKP